MTGKSLLLFMNSCIHIFSKSISTTSKINFKLYVCLLYVFSVGPSEQMLNHIDDRSEVFSFHELLRYDGSHLLYLEKVYCTEGIKIQEASFLHEQIQCASLNFFLICKSFHKVGIYMESGCVQLRCDFLKRIQLDISYHSVGIDDLNSFHEQRICDF